MVAGAGVFGATAALELRHRGWRVTQVDPGPLPNPDASSTDVSKVVRTDYGPDAFYHDLAQRALDGWDRWNVGWERPLYHETGFLLLAGDRMAPGGFEHESLQFHLRRESGIQRVDAQVLADRHPAWSPELYPDGYFNPRAGWADSGEVLRRLLEAGAETGVEHRRGAVETVLERESRVEGVRLQGGEELAADRVVAAAGAWTPRILPELTEVLEAVAQPVLFLAPEDPEPFHPPAFPPWAADIAGTGWYGFPALPDGIVKIGHHGVGVPVDPDEPGEVPEDHVRRCRDFLGRAIPPLAVAPVVRKRMCLYCDAADGDFLIAEDPGREGLVVASGGSGHAFKFAPLLGELVADAVEGRGNPWLHRFAWREEAQRLTEAARYLG